MNVLVTAFEPFGNAVTNSSLAVLEILRAQNYGPSVRFFGPLPTAYAKAWPVLEAQITGDITHVLALGQAETRTKLSLERVALNWIDARLPDNEGRVIQGQPVCDGEPLALWSTIPWEHLPASPQWELSYSAGTFVCNALLYELLRVTRPRRIFAGFVHVPLEGVRWAEPLQRILDFVKTV